MSTKDLLGPFQAGDGGLPPYLAGRASEQDICRAFLSRLRNGRAPPREIIFYGPRGNGKTALLVWLEREAGSFPGVDVIRFVPAAVRTERQLVERLLPASWWQRLTPSEISVYGIKWRPGEDRPPPLDEALAARARKGPLVLLLDEAHTLDDEVGCILLNASQQVGRELPFLLVLAGTPGLRARLGALNATFWNRAERCPVGRLDPSAPPQRSGCRWRTSRSTSTRTPPHTWSVRVRAIPTSFSSGARRYGGRSVEGRRCESGSSGTTWRAPRSPSIGKKNGYYLERYDELMERELLAPARTVADAFEERSLLSDGQLETAIARGLGAGCRPPAVAAARTTLGNLGYVWRPEIEPRWEAGIPNLMNYVQRHVSPP